MIVVIVVCEVGLLMTVSNTYQPFSWKSLPATRIIGNSVVGLSLMYLDAYMVKQFSDSTPHRCSRPRLHFNHNFRSYYNNQQSNTGATHLLLEPDVAVGELTNSLFLPLQLAP